MTMCFVNRNTKELLVTLHSDTNVEFDGNCLNTEYDAIKFDGGIEDSTYEKDGKTYLRFEYSA